MDLVYLSRISGQGICDREIWFVVESPLEVLYPRSPFRAAMEHRQGSSEPGAGVTLLSAAWMGVLADGRGLRVRAFGLEYTMSQHLLML